MTQSPYAHIAELTNRNDHSLALAEGAKVLGMPKLEKLALLVGSICETAGHLPCGIAEYRYSLYQQLMEEAERQLSPEDFALFRGAY